MPNDGKAPQTPQSAKRRTPHKHSGGFFDSEQATRLLLIGSVVALVVVALGFIGFGWYWTEVRPEKRTVLRVDEEKVSYAAMKRRMGYELFQSTALQQDPTTLADVAFDNLANELTIVTQADVLGVALSNEDFDARLRTRVGVSDVVDQRAVQDALRRQLDITGLKESEYRRLVLSEGLQEAIKTKYEGELPFTLLMAKVEVISAPSAEAAQAAIDRINAGEAFADVAKEISLETDVATTGGVKDFQPDGGLSAAYNDYAFSAPIGQLSGPLSATSGALNTYVVRVIERSEQPVRDDQKPTLASDQFDEWLTNTREELASSRALVDKFDEKARSDALVEVYTDASAEIAARQQAQRDAQIRQATLTADLTANPAPTAAPVTPGAAPSAAASTPADQQGGAEPTVPSQPVVPENGQ